MKRPRPEASTEDPTLGELIHRDAPKVGRRPKVRAGTRRSAFVDAKGKREAVLHYDCYTTDNGCTQLDGSPLPEPTDWVDATVSTITGAKLAIITYTDAIRDIPEERRRGVPDPRGPQLAPGDVLEASDAGVALRRGHSCEFVGRGEAVPAVMLLRIRAASPGELAPWFVRPLPSGELLALPLLRWLVELASGGTSGGSGVLSRSRLANLLRDPPALGRELMRRAGRSPELKSIAASLPRKTKSRA